MRIQEYYSNIITKARGRRGYGPTYAEAQRDLTQAVKSQSAHFPPGF